MTAPNQTLKFTVPERERIKKVAQALNTSIPDFLHWAAMQACDHVESLAEEVRERQRQQASMDWGPP